MLQFLYVVGEGVFGMYECEKTSSWWDIGIVCVGKREVIDIIEV